MRTRGIVGIVWLAPILLAGCNVPAWGNILVLAVTLALFFATVTLGRHVSTDTEGGSPTESETVRH